MELKKVNILGVKIDDVSMDQAVEIVEEWLKDGGRHYIVTPNPEFIIAAQKDLEFRRVLNNADLAIPDGVGLKLARFARASRRRRGSPRATARRASDMENTIAGVDFLERLCKVAAERGFTTGFLGGRGEVAKQAAECLQKKYLGLKVVFAEDGGDVDEEGEELTDYSLPASTQRGEQTTAKQKAVSSKLLAVDLLFVAFGQVKQEKWIAKNLDKLPVKVAMGVGGSFDYISGRVPRAPRWCIIRPG